jgi:hypothetical protein
MRTITQFGLLLIVATAGVGTMDGADAARAAQGAAAPRQLHARAVLRAPR